MTAPSGPLAGVRVLEMAAMGPVPFCGLVLSDLGADVVRVDRPSRPAPDDPMSFTEVLGRGRRSIVADLKTPEGVATALDLADRANVLLEGLLPGTMERLGLGPRVCLARNPGLVYARMTGYGQDGPLSTEPGHDINYLALSGALHAVGGPDGGPVPPLNLVGDFGGGGMLLTVGVLAALHEASRSGTGQVVDVAMTDGATLLMASVFELFGRGVWEDRRGANIFDSGAHFYTTYEAADGAWLAVGAVEPDFYAALLAGLGIDPAQAPQWDRTRWPQLRRTLAAVFATRTREQWLADFRGTRACVTPVLSLAETATHPYTVSRRMFQQVDGIRQPAVAPRFARTPGSTRQGAPAPGEHTDQILEDWIGQP
ncbi:CaiB/BaiF CoA-transferase family protein [Streptomyces plumbiresistens]|uniref:CaiB/BaiF CoA-transferase family protein n=1 Tax=Streptomyces plumbiresistens TaxID=511811 RepID=A0ABP7TEL6_9ACTN